MSRIPPLNNPSPIGACDRQSVLLLGDRLGDLGNLAALDAPEEARSPWAIAGEPEGGRPGRGGRQFKEGRPAG